MFDVHFEVRSTGIMHADRHLCNLQMVQLGITFVLFCARSVSMFSPCGVGADICKHCYMNHGQDALGASDRCQISSNSRRSTVRTWSNLPQPDHCLLTCMDVHRTSLGAANEAALARSSVNLHTFPAIATALHAVRVPQMWKSFQDVGLGSSSRQKC